MSICHQTEYCKLIDHCQYISNLYKRVFVDDNNTVSYKLLPNLFSIKKIKKNIKNRKRKIEPNYIFKETDMIKNLYSKFLKEHPPRNIFNRYNLMETSEVRDLAAKLCNTTNIDLKNINGGNNLSVVLECMINSNYYLIPPKCRFYCGCVKDKCMKLAGNTFDIIVADPPWWNKYIRRLKKANEQLSYAMMYNEDIAAIPVKTLLSDNTLVAVWCTNAPSNIAAVKELIFPEWGVQYVTTWYWLKLTVDLEPIYEFGSGSAKQPYERVMIGKVGEVKDLPHNLLFASVPSALHSHKPPLLDLLRPYVDCDNPQVLELFARYLLPNTVSVGFEALKWQHISLYSTESPEYRK